MSEPPSSENDTYPLLLKSMKLLGGERITTALANHTSSPYTHNFCLHLKPETDFKTAEKTLKPVLEEIEKYVNKTGGVFQFEREESKKTGEG